MMFISFGLQLKPTQSGDTIHRPSTHDIPVHRHSLDRMTSTMEWTKGKGRDGWMYFFNNKNHAIKATEKSLFSTRKTISIIRSILWFDQSISIGWQIPIPTPWALKTWSIIIVRVIRWSLLSLRVSITRSADHKLNCNSRHSSPSSASPVAHLNWRQS